MHLSPDLPLINRLSPPFYLWKTFCTVSCQLNTDCLYLHENKHMLKYWLIYCCLFLVSFIPTDAIDLSEDISLSREIHQLDSLMFDAMNRQDLDGVMFYFDKDLEFYHDKGGLDNYEQTKIKLANLFKNNRNNNFRRTLVPGSMEVYPVPGYGAIESCLHRFCHIENGKDDCGTFKNVMVWKKTAQGWTVTRVLSYDH